MCGSIHRTYVVDTASTRRQAGRELGKACIVLFLVRMPNVAAFCSSQVTLDQAAEAIQCNMKYSAHYDLLYQVACAQNSTLVEVRGYTSLKLSAYPCSDTKYINHKNSVIPTAGRPEVVHAGYCTLS